MLIFNGGMSWDSDELCDLLRDYFDEQCSAYDSSIPVSFNWEDYSSEDEYDQALKEYEGKCHAFAVDLIQQLERVTGSDNCPIASQCTICALDLAQDILETAEDHDCLEDDEALDCLEIDDGLYVPDYE